MRNRTPRGLVAAAVVAACAPAALAQPASASIWTEVPSGTTQNITAIEYQSATRFWYTTSAGAIFKRQANGSFAQVRAAGGVPLNDIEFQAGGAIGLAVGNGGLVLRSANGGDSWTAVAGIPVSAASGAFPNCQTTEPLGDVNAVRFASNGRAWLLAAGSQIATSQPPDPANVGAAGTWVDANRDTRGTAATTDDTCKVVPGYANGFADAFFASPDVGYFVAAWSSGIFFTSNNLASSAPEKPADAGNAGTVNRVIAGDPNNPNRMWSVNGTPYGISTTAYTRDGWQTADRWEIGNPKAREFPDLAPADVDFAGGTVLTAGDTGAVLNSIDGVTFFHNSADGALTTQRWNAVGLASASEGALGGDNGKLVLTTAANTIPDVAAPTGSIAGPATAVAGRPVTFTAAVADNAGGSGIDPAGYAWTATGTPGAAGPSATLTFPSSGSYTIRLNFRDLAGNVAQVTKSVSVSAATTPQDARPLPTLALTGKGNGATARLSRGKVKVVVRGRLIASSGCSGTVQVTIKQGNRLLAARTAKVGNACAFAQSVSLAKRKLGKGKTLAITMRFGGNSTLKPTTKNVSVKIKH